MTMRFVLMAPLLGIVMTACTAYSHTNVRLSESDSAPSKASKEINSERGKSDTLVVLALSGGGSRAAYWSATAISLMRQTAY